MAGTKNLTRSVVGTPRADGEYREIDVAFLHLNPENPRHDAIEDEPKIIEVLFDKEEAGNLARDIAKRGALSPLEIIGVKEMSGNPRHYVTLEGNRRICALILLSDPYRAPTAEIRELMLSLQAKTVVPKKVMGFVFPSDDLAQQWIDLRHMGGQGGVATKRWNPDQQANALARRTGGVPAPAKAAATQNLLANAVLDRLVELGLITDEQRALISLTTIARYVNTPVVRALLGLGKTRELVYTHEAGEVDAALTRLALDSLPGPNGEDPKVNSRSDRDERIAYARELVAEGVAPTTPLKTPAAPPKPEAKASTKGRRSKADPALQRRLITSAFTVDVDDQALLHLRREMMRIDIDNHEFACNYLLRAFVERTLVQFLLARRRANPPTDRQLLKSCADELLACGAPRPVHKVVNDAASNDSTPYGLNCLGAAVHGSAFPTRKDLLKYTATWTPALQFMLQVIKDSQQAKDAAGQERKR